jgi:hypothetical protein
MARPKAVIDATLAEKAEVAKKLSQIQRFAFD